MPWSLLPTSYEKKLFESPTASDEDLVARISVVHEELRDTTRIFQNVRDSLLPVSSLCLMYPYVLQDQARKHFSRIFYPILTVFTRGCSVRLPYIPIHAERPLQRAV
ncbi:hypothetical protein AVEN_155186-1 [Araneus ventricosus]|uniref:Uncharacterized protein n=1 Tax=Araneus ventricosus TaxID=182803 RepID=A0A4Y2MLM5_ARAVE|nr:hypothetical protein AVEN_155186-1 [Araneus ventricosus]